MAPREILPYKFVDNIPVPQLRSPEEWPAWRDFIERTAKTCGVWEVCNPEVPDDEYLKQQETLDEPSVCSVRPEAWGVTDLEDEDFEKLRSLVMKYKKKKQDYERKRDAIYVINDLIIASAAKYINRTALDLTPYQHLVSLSKMFSGPSSNDINKISAEWLELQELADLPDVQEYLTRWQALFEKCLDLNMADGPADRALGQSLLGSLDAGTMWKPLQFQEWFVKSEFPGLKVEEYEDDWGTPSSEADTEGHNKDEIKDGEFDVCWDSPGPSEDDNEDNDEVWASL